MIAVAVVIVIHHKSEQIVKTINIGNQKLIEQQTKTNFSENCSFFSVGERKSAYLDIRIFTDNIQKTTFSELKTNIDDVLYSEIGAGCDFEMLSMPSDDAIIGHAKVTDFHSCHYFGSLDVYDKPSAVVRFTATEDDHSTIEKEIDLMIDEILMYLKVSKLAVSGAALGNK